MGVWFSWLTPWREEGQGSSLGTRSEAMAQGGGPLNTYGCDAPMSEVTGSLSNRSQLLTYSLLQVQHLVSLRY